MRQSFDEPSWNNPVVRIVGADRKDLAPKLKSDWTIAGLAGLMASALKKTGKPVPKELADLTIRK